MEGLNPDAWEAMERVMTNWKSRNGEERGISLASVNGKGTTGVPGLPEADIKPAMGPGEWEDALGLPLCVVCQNVGDHPSWYSSCLN